MIIAFSSLSSPGHRSRTTNRSLTTKGFGIVAIHLLLLNAQFGGRFTTWAFSSQEHASSWASSPSKSTGFERPWGSKSSARSAINGQNGEGGHTFRDSWSLITLGDLHMEDDMSHHEQARRDCLDALEDYPILGAPTTSTVTNGANGSSQSDSFSELSKETLLGICESSGGDLSEEELLLLLARKRNKHPKSHIVSLGDLGRKDIRHEQGDAGTTKSFVDAKDYLDGFEGIPYDLVTVRKLMTLTTVAGSPSDVE